MLPLISVVITVYNRGPKVQATIDSAVNQTLPSGRLEVLVIDDGSTDGTDEILEKLYREDPRVRIIRQEQAGVAAARNRGLQEAKGEYIAYLDHDDRWLPDKLELQLQEFLRNPAVGVVYSGWIEVDEEGHALPNYEQMQKAPWWKPHTGWIYGALIPHNLIVSASVPLLRTDAVRRVGGWDPATVPCDDYDLWLRLAQGFEFGYVSDELVWYTRHSRQQSGDSYVMHQALYRTLRKHWRYLIFQPKKLWFLTVGLETPVTAHLYAQAKAALLAGNPRGVWVIIARTAWICPLVLISPRWAVLVKRLIAGNVAAYR